jgi:Leucine-rich repeat (LRR) protein
MLKFKTRDSLFILAVNKLPYMKRSIQLLSALTSLFVIGCSTVSYVPGPTSSTEKIVNTTSLSNTSEKETPITTISSEPAIIYDKNPNAAGLLSRKELLKKKVYKSIEEALVNSKDVYRLELSGAGIKRILTEDIGELYNLQELEIFNLYQNDIPKEIGKLKNLQYFNIQGFSYPVPLPNEVVNWKHLIKVQTYLNATEGNTFFVCENFLDPLMQVESIQEMRLSGTAIVRFPKNISNLANLEKLEVNSTENFTFNESLKSNKKLEKLYFSSNELAKLPENIGEIPNLKLLKVSYCKNLTTLPKSVINKFHNKELEIKLSGSGIDFPLPAPSYSYTRLVSSKPYSNAYKAEVYEMNPLSAKQLSFNDRLKKKKYTTLDEALKNPADVFRLELNGDVDVNGRLAEIGKLYNLQFLTIENLSAKELPKEIGKLKSLQHFELQTSVMNIPLPKEIQNWQEIEKIEITLNSKDGKLLPLDLLDAISILERLQGLSLDGESVNRLPLGLEKLQWLSSIKIKNTNDFSLPNNMADYMKLTSLKLQDMTIEELPVGLSETRYLQILDLYNVSGLTEMPDLLLKNELKHSLRITTSESSVTVPKLYSSQDKISPGDRIKVKHLDILYFEGDYTTAKEIWANIDQYTELELLNLPISFPKFTGGNLASLKSLKLTMDFNDKSDKIYADLGGFLNKTPNLEYLSSSEGYRAFPTDIYGLSKLKYIYLFMLKGHDKIVIPSKIESLSNLEELHVLVYHGTKTMDISTSLFSLTKLKKLVLMRNGAGGKTPVLDNFPEGIEQLINLEELVLNCIKTLPVGLEKLTKLKKVSIYNHTISADKIAWIKKQLPNTVFHFK